MSSTLQSIIRPLWVKYAGERSNMWILVEDVVCMLDRQLIAFSVIVVRPIHHFGGDLPTDQPSVMPVGCT